MCGIRTDDLLLESPAASRWGPATVLSAPPTISAPRPFPGANRNAAGWPHVSVSQTRGIVLPRARQDHPPAPTSPQNSASVCTLQAAPYRQYPPNAQRYVGAGLQPGPVSVRVPHPLVLWVRV